jgi:hypothetical protein|tara:strand:+ start:887 stop:1036 length:150 start_codon:yes stop_codon:yes gene_type:complete
MKIDWINSWNAGNKKEKYELCWRLGTVTLLELSYGKSFRFMILNFGFEI